MLHPATSCKGVNHATALSATTSPGNLPRLPAGLLTEPTLMARWVLGVSDPAGVAAAAALLPIAACLLFLEGVQSAAGGALSGMRDATGPLLIATIGSWAIGMPLGILLAWMTATPVLGLWGGLVVGGCLTTLLYLIRFRQRMSQRQHNT